VLSRQLRAAAARYGEDVALSAQFFLVSLSFSTADLFGQRLLPILTVKGNLFGHSLLLSLRANLFDSFLPKRANFGGLQPATALVLTTRENPSLVTFSPKEQILSVSASDPSLAVRSGGYSMELCETPERIATNVMLARDLGLNAIRLEGQLTSHVLFDVADEMGMLIT
jgi:hypothetical protein